MSVRVDLTNSTPERRDNSGKNVKKARWFLVLVLVSGCLVNDGFVSDSDFSCTEDDDCLSTYECKSQVCQKIEQGADEECTDEDGDGFGVGEKRARCRACDLEERCEEDFDDGDAATYPGAPDICDGTDNDREGGVDDLDITCATPSDCGSSNTLPPGVRLACEEGRCVAKMNSTSCATEVEDCPCSIEPLTCTNGSYPEVPEPCR